MNDERIFIIQYNVDLEIIFALKNIEIRLLKKKPRFSSRLFPLILIKFNQNIRTIPKSLSSLLIAQLFPSVYG